MRADEAGVEVRSALRFGFLSLLLMAGCSSGGGGASDDPGGGGGGGGGTLFPLELSSDDRRLEQSDGDAFLMTGDSAWSLMVALTQQQTEDYLEDRRQRGFNTVLVNLIERGFGGPANAEGELPFDPADDFTAPNEDYFAHADWVIDRAAAKGMLVLLAPAYLGVNCGSQGWCEQMLDQPVSAMQTYGRFLGDRYGNRDNILWVHGGDTDASDHGVESRVNAIANGIIERAPAQLHTAHCSRNNSGIDCYDEPWLDVNTTYSSCGGSFNAVRTDYARMPTQAFFFIEGTYENSGASLGCLIDQAAWAVLGGGAGHVFGNTPIWRFGTGWQGELDSPGSEAMGHLADLFASRAWFRLRPDVTGDVVVAGGSGATAGITSDGESILVYVSSARTLTIDLSLLSGVNARSWWFDPSDGSSTDLGFSISGGLANFAAPGRGVLVIDDASSGLSRPGSEPY
jgi:hypothetical protein